MPPVVVDEPVLVVVSVVVFVLLALDEGEPLDDEPLLHAMNEDPEPATTAM
jgi:hypothetical protein